MTVPKVVTEMIGAARGNGATSWLLALILCGQVGTMAMLYWIVVTLGMYSSNMEHMQEPVEQFARIMLEQDTNGLMKIHAVVNAARDLPGAVGRVDSNVDRALELLNSMHTESQPPARPHIGG